MLLIGGFLGLFTGIVGLVAGWVTGVVLLWASPRWRWPDKLAGTLIWPGGLATSFLLLGTPGPPLAPWLSIPLAIASIATPILLAMWLLSRARRVPDPGEPPFPQLIES